MDWRVNGGCTRWYARTSPFHYKATADRCRGWDGPGRSKSSLCERNCCGGSVWAVFSDNALKSAEIAGGVSATERSDFPVLRREVFLLQSG